MAESTILVVDGDLASRNFIAQALNQEGHHILQASSGKEGLIFAWRDRPDFTCFQNASETANIARGAAAELGPLANTQAKPEVGPYAVTTKR